MADESTNIDVQLRPKTLGDYLGQEKAKKSLQLFIDAAKKRNESAEHLLFYGPPGIGKTTLAHILARELNGDIKITSGPAMERSGDLAAILTNLKNGDILFIDEIHRMPKPVEEALYPVLEEYHLDIIIGKGPAARTVRLPVPKITVIGATTRVALLSSPLRDRFGLILRLEYYTPDEITHIVMRNAKLMKLPISEDAAFEIAKRSRKTPRIANRILKRARDLLQTDTFEEINKILVEKLWGILELDSEGLFAEDKRYLKVLIEKFEGGPVGVETLATALSEDRQTLEEYTEPYLLQLGFIKRTPQGRVASPKAYDHLGLKPSQN
ncbi:MAG: Holliday junction branch migration DNA helicase RuvB [Patescibacteria group bacterium]|jgi:Holliday junction DNA helicase RuvB